MRKVLLIMNPNAGVRQSRQFLINVLETFSKADYVTTVMLTKKRGDACDFAEKYAGDYDKLVCIGGDGTLNEVINGLLNGGHKTPLGYIPAGSTNDFATSLCIPKSIPKAAGAIVSGEPVTLDVGCFSGHYFSYVASFGAFSKASFSAPQNLKNVLGRMAYLLEGIKDLSTIKPIHMTVKTDTFEVEDDYIFGAITNSTSVAGILSFDPDIVSMNDGKFEVLFIKYPKNLIVLNEIVISLLAQQYDHPNIMFSSASKGTFICDSSVDWTVDGEQAENKGENTVNNIHNAISVILDLNKSKQKKLPAKKQ